MTINIKNTLAPVREQVVEAYKNGATLRQIAEVHGVSSGTVRNCLLGSDVARRKRGRRKKGAKRTNDLLAPIVTDEVVEATVEAPVAEVAEEIKE